MWPFSSAKKTGTRAVIQIDGLHCSSCVLNIDGTLEELRGVISSSTHYAKARTEVEYDPATVDVKAICTAIEDLGYGAKLLH